MEFESKNLILGYGLRNYYMWIDMLLLGYCDYYIVTNINRMCIYIQNVYIVNDVILVN